MNDTRNINRTVLRIVTVTGAASRAAGAAVGRTTRDSRRPEDFDITIGTALHLAPHLAGGYMQFLIMLFLS